MLSVGDNVGALADIWSIMMAKAIGTISPKYTLPYLEIAVGTTRLSTRTRHGNICCHY